MGAKEFAEVLPLIQRARIEAALVALTNDERPMSGAERLSAALDALAEGVRAEAGAAEQQKPKGWQSMRDRLLATAGKLNDLAKEVDAISSTPMPPDPDAPRERDPGRGIEPGGDPNLPGTAERSPDGFVYQGSTPGTDQPVEQSDIERHLSRLSVEAAMASAGHGEDARQGENVEAPVSPSAETMAYLRGDTATPLMDQAHQEARTMLADRRTQATDEDPFTDPAAPVTLAPPLTFADITRPIHRADLTHWSHSQLETLGSCGVKYAAQKLLKLPSVPQWSLVGGRAFHAAVEIIERDISAHATIGATRPADPGDIAKIWLDAFSATIAEIAAEAPVPPAQWRASAKGAEGFDWWRVQGEDMLERYAKMRIAGIDAAQKAGLPQRTLLNVPDPVSGEPTLALEVALSVMVPGPMGETEFQSIPDQAWFITQPDGHASILIVDIKTGRIPSDTWQLGSQALTLAQVLGLDPAHASDIIEACFYDARKGVFTAAFKPLERHPYSQLVYDVHTAEFQRRQGIYRAHTSPFCGGCPVKYACPVMNGAGK